MNNGKPESLLLSEVCRIINGTLYGEDKRIKKVSFSITDKIEEGDLFFAFYIPNVVDTYSNIPLAISENVAAIVTDKYIENFPCIVVQEPMEALLKLTEWYRERMNIKVVAVTGSIGKTTTKLMISSVLKDAFQMEENRGNNNSAHNVAQGILGLQNTTEVYLQEKSMTYMHLSSLACKPTIAVVTNIGHSHARIYGTRENIFIEKMKIVDGMDKNSVVILNIDDDLLCGYKDDMGRKIITYSLENKEADFRATDIEKDDMGYHFNICYQGKKQKARINCQGRHNVINAVAAYIVGLQLKMDKEDILRGLEEYRPTSIRQNIFTVGETTVYADCFNASPVSMKYALDTLEEYDLSAGTKVAVLGDMTGYGDYTKEFHAEIGRYLNHKKIDRVIFYGEEMSAALEVVNNSNIKVDHILWRSELMKILKDEVVNTKSVVLFKASSAKKLAGVIDELFATEFTKIKGKKNYRMQNVEMKALRKYFSKNSVNTVAVYGLGVGERVLLETLEKCGVSVNYAIDRKAKYLPEGIYPVPVKYFGQELEKVDMIIVTLLGYEKELVIRLQNEAKTDKVLYFNELYENAMEGCGKISES